MIEIVKILLFLQLKYLKNLVINQLIVDQLLFVEYENVTYLLVKKNPESLRENIIANAFRPIYLYNMEFNSFEDFEDFVEC